MKEEKEEAATAAEEKAEEATAAEATAEDQDSHPNQSTSAKNTT